MQQRESPAWHTVGTLDISAPLLQDHILSLRQVQDEIVGVLAGGHDLTGSYQGNPQTIHPRKSSLHTPQVQS